MRFAKSHHRKDANHDEIVKALEKEGFSVVNTSCVGGGFPDLVVGYLGRTFLLEIKDGSAPLKQRALTDKEQKFHGSWGGHAAVVSSVKEAIEAIRRERTE